MLPICFRFRPKEEIESYLGTYEYYSVIEMAKLSNLPVRAWKDLRLAVNAEDIEAYTQCNEYKNAIIENVENGKGLFISGGVGSGKTVWTYKIARHYIESTASTWDEKTIPVYFANVPRLLDDFRAAFQDNAKMASLDHVLTTAKLVIFDDLGAENATEWAKDKLYQYIDYRYANCLASVFTSNKDIDYLDSRIADRIRGTCHQVEFKMSSKRQITAQGETK